MPTTTRKSNPAETAERKLAERIAKLRSQGLPYDGPNGICGKDGIPSTATKCRALLRAHGKVQAAGGIGKSYDRTPEFRAEESARRKAKAEAAEQPAPKRTRKAQPKASAPKRAPRKATAKS